jgi:hypothetical protein
VDSQEGKTGDSFDALLDQLLLDIKAVAVLSQNNSEYSQRALGRISGAKDLDVQEFLSLLSRRFRKSSLWSFIIAVGEIAMAGILLFLSLGLIVPSFFAYDNPQAFLNYFTERVTLLHPGLFITSLLALLLFSLGATLIIGAFAILKVAANTLEDSGLTS